MKNTDILIIISIPLIIIIYFITLYKPVKKQYDKSSLSFQEYTAHLVLVFFIVLVIIILANNYIRKYID